MIRIVLCLLRISVISWIAPTTESRVQIQSVTYKNSRQRSDFDAAAALDYGVAGAVYVDHTIIAIMQSQLPTRGYQDAAFGL